MEGVGKEIQTNKSPESLMWLYRDASVPGRGNSLCKDLAVKETLVVARG